MAPRREWDTVESFFNELTLEAIPRTVVKKIC